MQWPAWSVQMMQVFLSREPPAAERSEVAIAHLTSIYLSAHMKKGASRPKVGDFLLFRDAWERKLDASRYSDDERKTMLALGLKLK